MMEMHEDENDIETVHTPWEKPDGEWSRLLDYLAMTSNQLGADLREMNSIHQQRLIGHMTKSLSSKNINTNRNNNDMSIICLKYLASILEHLTQSAGSCVKSATLRLRSKDGFVVIHESALGENFIGEKDTTIRKPKKTGRNSSGLVASVYSDCLDRWISDVKSCQNRDPSSPSGDQLYNLEWMKNNNITSLTSFGLCINESTPIGTLTLYNGHMNIIAVKDFDYFRIITNLLQSYISQFIEALPDQFYGHQITTAGNLTHPSYGDETEENKIVERRLDNFVKSFSQCKLIPERLDLDDFIFYYKQCKLLKVDISDMTATVNLPADSDKLGDCILILEDILTDLTLPEQEKALVKLLFNTFSNPNVHYILFLFLSNRHYPLFPETIKFISELLKFQISSNQHAKESKNNGESQQMLSFIEDSSLEFENIGSIRVSCREGKTETLERIENARNTYFYSDSKPSEEQAYISVVIAKFGLGDEYKPVLAEPIIFPDFTNYSLICMQARHAYQAQSSDDDYIHGIFIARVPDDLMDKLFTPS
jgi:hypothetical protein